MSKEKIFQGIKESKDYIIFVLLLVLFLLPLLKQLFPNTVFLDYNNYAYILITGIGGIIFFAIDLILKLKKDRNKKYVIKEKIPLILFFLYMIWTLISCICAKDINNSFWGTCYRKEGYFTYLAYSGIFGLAFLIDSDKIKRTLLYSFTIIATALIFFIQIYNSLDFKPIDITTASFSQFNHFGYYLMIATSISCFLFITENKKSLKVINIVMYVYLLFFLIYNNTFGCYLALFNTLLIYFVYTLKKKSNKLFILIILALFIGTSLIVSNKSNNNIALNNIKVFINDILNINNDNSDSNWEKIGTGRSVLWKYGIQFFLEKPILGFGAENLGEKYYEVGVDQDRPHNILIQQATTSGIPRISSILLSHTDLF